MFVKTISGRAGDLGYRAEAIRVGHEGGGHGGHAKSAPGEQRKFSKPKAHVSKTRAIKDDIFDFGRTEHVTLYINCTKTSSTASSRNETRGQS